MNRSARRSYLRERLQEFGNRLRLLPGNSPTLRLTYTYSNELGGWVWWLVDAEGIIAICPDPYPNHDDCIASMDRFNSTLAQTITPTLI